jgi:hypothetical protein
VRGKNKETRPNDPGLSYGRPSARRVPNLAGGRPSNNAAGCWRFHRDRETLLGGGPAIRAINSEVARSHVADITMTAGKTAADFPRFYLEKCIVRVLDIRACRCRLFDASWLTRRFAWHHRVKEPRRPLHDSVRRVTERQTHERNVGSGFSGSHQLGKTPPRPLPALAFHSLGHPEGEVGSSCFPCWGRSRRAGVRARPP